MATEGTGAAPGASAAPSGWGSPGQFHPGPSGAAVPGFANGWQRLHPLTPVALAARVLVLFIVVFAEDSARGQGSTGASAITFGVFS
ncbi:MAG TPA: hypothetical protein VFN61_00590, partial [Acidimicrobiales bacterium]|nr:hypothetical protein [Acidimicrobiales bacterium]